MTLTRQEMLELEAQDGVLAEPETRELREAAAAWAAVAGPLREALRPPSMPSLADSIMEFVVGDREGAELVAAGALAGESARAEAGTTSPLWDGVSSGIEAEWLDTQALLREAVRAEAGEVHLADAVLAAIAVPEGNVIRLDSARRRAPSAPHALRSRRPFVERYLPTIVGMAAAAALLVVFWTPAQPSGRELAYELSPVNRVEIEDISGDSNAMVEVLAFDDDSPPIIFIDEGADGLDIRDSEGTPL